MAEAADERGWRLVQIAARNIPDVPGAATVRLPARLWEFARRMRHRPQAELETLPSWLQPALADLHVDWEHRRWPLHRYEPGVVDGVHRLAWYAETVVEQLRPAVVLTTNKIDHPCDFFQRAAANLGVSTGIVERSPFETIWFEPEGIFAESRIWDQWGNGVGTDQYEVTGSEVIRRLLSSPAGFRAAEMTTRTTNLPEVDGPRVFVPLDNLLWTGWAQEEHPQGVRDNPLFASPQSALDELGNWADRIDALLVVKPHPSCVETARLRLPPNAVLVDADLQSLMQQCDAAVTFNTKLAFVTLAAGMPTATLSDNPAAAGGQTSHWSNYDSAEDAFRSAAVEQQKPEASSTAAFFGWLDAEYFVALEPTAGRVDPPYLVHQLTEVDTTSRTVVGLEEKKLNVLEDLSQGKKQSAKVDANVSRRRPRVVLDVSRTVQPEAQHSGIARYARELLATFGADDDFELWGIVEEPSSGWSRASSALFSWVRKRLGGRLIAWRHEASWATRLAQLPQLSSTDIYHSTHPPLPPSDVTGHVIRLITVHDVLHLVRPELDPSAGVPTIQRVLDSINSDTDHVVCPSDQTRRDLLSLLPIRADHVHVVPMGVNGGPSPDGGHRWRSFPQWPGGYVISILQSEPRKNLESTVHALSLTLNRPNNADKGAVLVTSRGTYDRVREAVAAEDLDARVEVVLDPDDAQLAALLDGANLFLFGSRYEGFGFPPAEAMARGCPTVVVANSSLVEVCGDAPVYAPDESAESLDRAANVALQYGGSARRHGSGRRRVGTLSWDASVGKLKGLYGRLTGSSSPDRDG